MALEVGIFHSNLSTFETAAIFTPLYAFLPLAVAIKSYMLQRREKRKSGGQKMSLEERITRWAMGKRFLPVLTALFILSTFMDLFACVSRSPQFLELPCFFLLFFPSIFLCLISFCLYDSPTGNVFASFFGQVRAAPWRSVLFGLVAVALLFCAIFAWVDFVPLERQGRPAEYHGRFLLRGNRGATLGELPAQEFIVYRQRYYRAEGTALLSTAMFCSFLAIILKVTAKITKDPFALPDWADRT